MTALNESRLDGEPLALICGGGRFPLAVADAATRSGRRVVLFPIRGWADPAIAARYPHQWVALGQFNAFLRRARAERCRDIVFIGTVLRPSIRQLRFDFTMLRLLPRIIRIFRGGDNHLLSGLGEIMASFGFKLHGAHEIAPEILIPEGTLGRHEPSARDAADITLGLSLLAAMGPFDVGQAAVVANNHVLAVEAAEGTDQMLTRVGALRNEGRINLPDKVGVLVKAPKRDQDRRFDLPSVGDRTVDGALGARLAGIAVEAAGAITVDLQHLIRSCDDAGLFLVGIRHGRGGERP